MQQEAPPTPFSSGDNLADIYDACVGQDRPVNSAARLRASAVSDLKAFDGRYRDEFKGKAWLSSVRAAFRRDQFTDGECCLHLPDLLSDRSKTWYRQLPRTVRADWGRLQAEFEQEYCGATVTPQQRYFEMRRRANEEPIDYLYHLNVQAREAGLAYDRPENARPHVRQFISSCEDPELARQLAGLRLSNEEELRDVLKQLLYQSMRAKRDDIGKGRTSKRDQDQARELREGLRLNGTSSDDSEYSDSDVSDEESDIDPHDVSNGGQEVDSITRDDDRGVDRLEPTRQDAVELLSKVYALLQKRDQGKSPPSRDRPRQVDPCSHCGSQRHRDRDCWRRLTCDACGRPGHPAEHCYQRCKGCGKIHDRGECPLEEIANQLRACRKDYRQTIVPAKINDRSARVLLDSGAEVSIIDSTFVRKADIEVDHSEQLRCAGVGGSAFHTEGKARIKVTLGGELAYECDVWVGPLHGTHAILGTDFMTPAGVRLDLAEGVALLPDEVRVRFEGRRPVYSDRAEQVRIKAYSTIYPDVTSPVDWTTVAIASLAARRIDDVPGVDQADLGPTVFIHEGADMAAEEIEGQMALIPEMPNADRDISIEDIVWRRKEYLMGKGNARPPAARGVVCDIDVCDARPIAQRCRRVPPQYSEKLYELIKGLLDAGFIVPSTSPWASPIVIVVKKNGVDIRLCIDYRVVNELTRLMVYPMPIVQDLLEDLAAYRWFCSLDMASGFWVVKMTPRARAISAFVTPFGLFEWTRMPFGLKNAPQIYQRLLDNALYGFLKLTPEHEQDGRPDVFDRPVPEDRSTKPAVDDGLQTRSGRLISRLFRPGDPAFEVDLGTVSPLEADCNGATTDVSPPEDGRGVAFETGGASRADETVLVAPEPTYPTGDRPERDFCRACLFVFTATDSMEDHLAALKAVLKRYEEQQLSHWRQALDRCPRRRIDLDVLEQYELVVRNLEYADNATGDEFAFSAILREAIVDGEPKVLVQWEPTWEPVGNVCKSALKKYRDEQRNKRKVARRAKKVEP
ncbi:hypothetical protein P43SY_002493 [Pythium insidiosum]|uniref:Peptidase A2 domain-containing protein n=1 Tax=Pythium insidiosum TaxID=114742 RepID=A0AAD5LB42_PYTIN|nr:hypothetical protein P43SY_002493 [Pythium insidiosum]